jgi:hypothetical protein
MENYPVPFDDSDPESYLSMTILMAFSFLVASLSPSYGRLCRSHGGSCIDPCQFAQRKVMLMSQLILHRGARAVSREELDEVPTPNPTNTWFPVGHSHVLDQATETLGKAGFLVRKQSLALSREGARFFGTLDLEVPLVTGVHLAVGLRNSIDQSLPLGFCAGSRVFVCDNLSFQSELLVNRKHTRNGQARFAEAIALAVQSLHAFRQAEAQRIRKFQHRELTDENADALILRVYEKNFVSYRALPRVISEWRNPSFEDFQPRTLWSLLNAFTTILGERHQSNPQQFASLTIGLQAFLEDSASQIAYPQAA